MSALRNRKAQILTIDALIATFLLLAGSVVFVKIVASTISAEPAPSTSGAVMAKLLSEPEFINRLYSDDTEAVRRYLKGLETPFNLTRIGKPPIALGKPYGIAFPAQLTGYNGTLNVETIYFVAGG